MFVPLFPFPVPIPLIGEQLLPPNRPSAPSHGLTAESVTSASLRKKNRPIYPPISKWQIGLGWW